MQSPIDLEVALEVQAMAVVSARGDGDRCDAGESCEGVDLLDLLAGDRDSRGLWHGSQAPGDELQLATQQDDDERPKRVSAADLDALRGDLQAMLNDSDPKRVKGVLQIMIDGIRVDARDQNRTDLSRTRGPH